VLVTRSPLHAMPAGVTPPASSDSPVRGVGAVDHAPPALSPVPEPAGPHDVRGAERLWHDVHDRLTAFVAQRVDAPADVADLVQTVFLRAHQHMASVADEQRLLPWLFQVTRNAIADYYRSPVRRREIGGIARDGALELPDGHRMASTLPPTGEPGPLHPASPRSASDDESALRELAGCVRPLVQLLPPPYREALTLVEFDGVAQVDVASRLGISVSGMKSRVQRGRAMLRDGLLACCDISRSATGGVLDFAPRSDVSCGAAGSGPSPDAPCGDVVPLRRAPSACRAPGGPTDG
jgi:RNA polymerase sigma-70 factor, ECF subfamily